MNNKYHPIKPCFIITFMLLLATGVPGWAQTHRQLQVEGTARISAERDYGFSPLRYIGAEWGGGLTYIKQNNVKTSWVNLNFQTGNLSNQFETAMQVYSGNIITYNFYHAHKLPNSGWHWGWANNNEFELRNNEAITNFNNRNEYFTSFGPAIRYQLPFGLFKRNFSFQAIGNVQLLGFTVLSSYVSPSPSGFVSDKQSFLKSTFSSLGVFYPGNAINAGYKAGLEYEFKSQNKLTLNYEYNYLRIKGEHIVEKSRGKWSIAIIVRL
ncbi:MAG TPA: hypothetical protein VJY41_11310 [Prolixibacteraceae bacterium]|nr:hypothetical protein [Prolixibacteraceae bacterium]